MGTKKGLKGKKEGEGDGSVEESRESLASRLEESLTVIDSMRQNQRYCR
jgi:hypothetical protein